MRTILSAQIRLVLFLACMLLPSLAHAAAFTVKATGDWNSPGQTTWNEVGVPGDGDTVSCSVAGAVLTVNVATTVGNSPGADTDVITLTSTCQMVVAANLTVKGRVSHADSVTVNAGVTVTMYTVTSGVAYSWRVGTSGAQPLAKLILNGSSGSHVVFQTEGTTNAKILTAGTSAGQFTASYTDFSALGASGTSALAFTATGSVSITHSTWTSCGRIDNIIGAATDHTYTNNTHSGSLHATEQLRFTYTAATTGARTVTDNIFDDVGEKKIVFLTGVKNLTFERNYFTTMQLASITDYSAPTSMQYNLYAPKTAAGPQDIAIPGMTWTNNYMIAHHIQNNPLLLSGYAAGSAGTFTASYNVMDYLGTDVAGEFFKELGVITAAVTYNIDHNIVTPNASGTSGGHLVAQHGNKYNVFNITHNTIQGGTTSHPPIYVGADWQGKAGVLASVKDNLVWNPSANGYVTWQAPTFGPYSGTADAGSNATTLVDAAPSPSAFTTLSNRTPADGPGTLYIVSGTGAGQSATVTGGTASTLTFSALGTALDNTSVYRMNTVDIATPSGLNYNYKYNLSSGTVYDNTGGNGLSKTGYANFWLSNQAIGANDVTATGTNPTTDGPKFVDTTRNLATFPSAYLGYTAANGAHYGSSGQGAWNNAHGTYNVGDIVSNTNASFFGSVTVLYRCITAHNPTGVANDQPGAESAWTTYWELAGVYEVREALRTGATITDSTLGLSAVSYPQAALAWVRKGFQPRDLTVKASSTGGWIGAVDGSFGCASSLLLMGAGC